MSFASELRKVPPAGKTVAFTAATLGITYGYDISNIAGALLFLPADLGLNTNQAAAMATSVVVGQILGAMLGGVVADKFGRRNSMLLIAAGYAIFAVLSMLAPGTATLLLCRTLLGFTIGLSVSIVPVFIAEAAPSRVRGGLLAAYQVATVIGVVSGYIICWLLSFSESWRLMLGVAAVPALVVLAMLFRLTETPTYLMMQGREREAAEVLHTLEGDPRRVDEELASIREALSEQSERGSLREMFSGYLARATMFAIVLGFFVQITGINATIYYAPQIFEQMGYVGNTQQLLLPALVQFFSLIAVVVSMNIIDDFGRRKVLLSGIGVMIFANVLLVITYGLGGGFSGFYQYLGLFAIVIFTMGFTFGFGALVWVYAGEIFPAKYRALGSSIMLTADLVANAIVAQAFPPLLGAVGGTGVFMIFGALCLFAFLFVLRFAPETKGRNLEDIHRFWANGAKWDAQIR
ncbi:sugar porter family MFS transporter [Corynebacterium liangguodongii]|uniref:MFS transporter n=1 Tax=Corynebacterium liangguodongii TaxID=2079535 RepID=A0A2S0WC09_9CORY|nr:sugar porter family MFS transporter [Corynebacterium liangguodongii]AWB83309.1 MFS transporter [Corynebacterium liangguodongii]PWC00601.1 MFS transporter [Corynebacterium liangguodongii]